MTTKRIGTSSLFVVAVAAVLAGLPVRQAAAAADLQVKITEADLDSVAQALVQSKALSIGEYTLDNGSVYASYYATATGLNIDIADNNVITASGTFEGYVTATLGGWWDVTLISAELGGNVWLDGSVALTQDGANGWLIKQNVSSSRAQLTWGSCDGVFAFLCDMIGIMLGYDITVVDWHTYIGGQLEFSLGSKLLPNFVSSYFTSANPSLITTDPGVLFFAFDQKTVTSLTPTLFAPLDVSILRDPEHSSGNTRVAWYGQGQTVYNLKIDDDVNFGSPLVNATNLNDAIYEVFIPSQNIPSWYYWRVQGKNSQTGSLSSWSQTWRFKRCNYPEGTTDVAGNGIDENCDGVDGVGGGGGSEY